MYKEKQAAGNEGGCFENPKFGFSQGNGAGHFPATSPVPNALRLAWAIFLRHAPNNMYTRLQNYMSGNNILTLEPASGGPWAKSILQRSVSICQVPFQRQRGADKALWEGEGLRFCPTLPRVALKQN